MQNDVLEMPPRSTCSGSSLDENASVTLAVEQMQSQKAESVIVTRNGLAVGMVTDIVDKVVLKGEASYYYLCDLVSCQARYLENQSCQFHNDSYSLLQIMDKFLFITFEVRMYK